MAGKTLVLSALSRRFYSRPAVEVARDLLGRILVHETPQGRVAGRIVETEAYDQTEAASHCYRGQTPRNQIMFARAGHVYVYRSYGIHWCSNLVTGARGFGAAVLLRAVEPLEGVPLMQRWRGDVAPRDLTRGPGRLCQAMGITDAHDGLDATQPPLWVGNLAGRFKRPDIRVTTRIGISKAKSLPWRFCVAGNRFVSGPKRLR